MTMTRFTHVVRHDWITLHDEAKGEEFERFMKERLIPYFAEKYRGPTRVSIADITGQSLLKDSAGGGRWLWVTTWDGNADAVRGAAFENTRMFHFEETEAMLKKLEAFGKREAEQVYDALDLSEGDDKS
jgi:hypothetical protein